MGLTYLLITGSITLPIIGVTPISPFRGSISRVSPMGRQVNPKVQGRKRQYDLLQRTAPLTGGQLQEGNIGFGV